MSAYRVAVTGIGIVSPLGIGVDRFWDATLSGRIAVGPVTRFDTSSYVSRVAAEVNDFDAHDFMHARRVRRTDRFSQFAVAATRLALDDAHFEVNGQGHDAGVYIGSALGGVAYGDEQHDVFRERGIGAIGPLLAISVFGGAATCNVALEFGLQGPNVANGNSCASGAVAIGDAFRAVSRGDVRLALAGGAEAPLAPLVYGAFTVIGAMSKRNEDPAAASRPFDRNRDGFVMAEGAAMLLLERWEDAVARDARIYGEIIGYGLTGDAHHMTAPQPGGESAARAMVAAMREAGVDPGDVDLIDAHGSATLLNDKTETLAIRKAFGARAATIPVMATKGQHGHALGATGAWEAGLSLLTMARGRVPRVVNLDVDDPECDLAYVRTTTEAHPQTVLSNSSGFGGINAALVFRAPA